LRVGRGAEAAAAVDGAEEGHVRDVAVPGDPAGHRGSMRGGAMTWTVWKRCSSPGAFMHGTGAA